MKIFDKIFMKKSEINKYLVFVFLFALFLRILFICLSDSEFIQGSDQYHYDRTAKGILNGEGYHTLNLLAKKPPLFAYFISAIYLLFGTNVIYVMIIQAIIGSVTCLLVYLVGSKIDSKATGLLGATLTSVFPQLVRYPATLMSETLFIFLIFLTILTVLISEERLSIIFRVQAGILIGLVILTREAGLLILLGILVWYIYTSRCFIISLKKWSLIVLFVCLTVLPWTLRNYLTFNSFVTVSANGGIAFYIGNNPKATGSYKWVLPPGAIYNKKSPYGKIELETNSFAYREGLKFITEHPIDFLRLTIKKAFLLFHPPYHNISARISNAELIFRIAWLIQYSFIFLFAFIIGPYLFRDEMKKWSLLYILLFFLSVPYLITFVTPRYRLPLMPLMIILASGAICRSLSCKYNIGKYQ